MSAVKGSYASPRSPLPDRAVSWNISQDASNETSTLVLRLWRMNERQGAIIADAMRRIEREAGDEPNGYKKTPKEMVYGMPPGWEPEPAPKPPRLPGTRELILE